MIAVRTGFGVFCRRSSSLYYSNNTRMLIFLRSSSQPGKLCNDCLPSCKPSFWHKVGRWGRVKTQNFLQRFIHRQVSTLYVVISARYPGNPQTWQHCFSEGAICKSTVNSITNVKIELYHIFVRDDGMIFSEILRFC